MQAIRQIDWSDVGRSLHHVFEDICMQDVVAGQSDVSEFLKHDSSLVREFIDDPIFEHIVGFDRYTLKVLRILGDIDELFLPQNSAQKLKLGQFFAILHPEIFSGIIVDLRCVKCHRREETLAFSEWLNWDWELRRVTFTKVQNPMLWELLVI